MARPLVRLGVALAVLGLVGAVWYWLAGTHGCDQAEAYAGCDRMERDFIIYVISLATFTAGLVVTCAIVLTRRFRA